MTTLGGSAPPSQEPNTKKKKKNRKGGGKKKKKPSNPQEKTVSLTRMNRDTHEHVVVTIPHVGTEADSGDSTDSEDIDDAYDDEGLSGYRKGGYHPVNLGETYHGRYRVVHKLGWGQFSTVWLALDMRHSRYVALKFIKSAKHYSEAADDEIAIMKELSARVESTQSALGQDRLCTLLDSFRLVGPHGKHTALVFPVLGNNLWTVIKDDSTEGLPLPLVHRLARQLLEAMSFMHARSIIHTDLKPENLALEKPEAKIRAIMNDHKQDSGDAEDDGDEEDGEEEHEEREEEQADEEPNLVVVDFGNACWVKKQFTSDIQTTQYRAPEVIIRASYATPCDMWSVACILFELATGDQLFTPRASRKGHHGKDDDHLAQMIELVSQFPKSMIQASKRGPQFFDNRCRLRRIKSLKPWPLHSVLHEKYAFPEEEAHAFADFLLPMLQLQPAARATADEMLQHEWLRQPPAAKQK